MNIVVKLQSNDKLLRKYCIDSGYLNRRTSDDLIWMFLFFTGEMKLEIYNQNQGDMLHGFGNKKIDIKRME